MVLIINAVIALALLFAHSTTNAQSSWEPTSGPYGGSLTTFVTTVQGDVYAGADDGIYRTTDLGQVWVKVYDAVSMMTVTSIQALVADSMGTVYAGTFLGGVLRSTNNGTTWTSMNNGLTTMNVQALAINSSMHVFAGTDIGVFRSTDGGGTWTEMSSGLTKAVMAMVIDENDEIYAGTTGGVYLSTNSGTSWMTINTGLTNTQVTSLALGANRSLSAAGMRMVYAGTLGGGVFGLNRALLVWNAYTNGLTGLIVYSLVANLAGDLFAGTLGDGIFRLLAGATVWTVVNSGLLPYLYVAAILAHPSGLLFAALDWGGAFVSGDNGATWLNRSIGLTAYLVYAFYYNAALNNLFLGTNTGLFRSATRGSVWSLIQHPNVFFYVTAMVAASGYLFAGTFFEGVWRSSDNGATWAQVSNGLTSLFITAMVVNALGHIYVGTFGGVFMSTDMGASWSAVNTGLTTLIVTSLLIGQGYLFAGTSGGGVFKMDLAGTTWTQVVNGLTGLFVTALAFDLIGNLYAATNGDGVFRSSNLGNAWVAVVTGLLYLYVDAILYDGGGLSVPAGMGTLYAATPGGIFRSTDQGDNWAMDNGGLSSTRINRLAADTSGTVYAASYGGGVYRKMQPTSVGYRDNTAPERFALLQNFPNPFNPSTTIKFDIDEGAFVNLSIFDQLGRRIKTLVNENLSPGAYQVKFDAKDFATGVYMYRIQAGNKSAAKKMLLMK